MWRNESYLGPERFISNEQVSCTDTFSVSERGSQGTPLSFVWNLNDQCAKLGLRKPNNQNTWEGMNQSEFEMAKK